MSQAGSDYDGYGTQQSLNAIITNNMAAAFDTSVMPSPSVLSAHTPFQHHNAMAGLQE